ncbi:flavin-containing monooxygenase [Alteraurantiacibacter aquimixticola]|uniref:NAD(P)/FAD-dependent oxidoreductase n=1 Tax=Alteraurantiacibacter aquimixticola TaxID=2489173 RepID=A0A4T3F059_9SPHN|nr:NAD(P)/FAD-dependent oxidoreductase [Alteraurantiacibacter aquimixticola]TIX49562.1 NAD(P)/FAD-dependent oxidoreductase [Alteraurantiacibacter aquimixticola]
MADHLDVLIVGAGISGISMAAHLKMMCPTRSFAIIERRAQIGGTWDLFRYPGVRSDSDMHTLGFRFEPWKHEDAIADGPAILEYLNRTADERGITEHIRFETTVVSADWHSDEALWHVTLEDAQGWRTETTHFLFFASGYYDYDKPHEADIPGLADFGGTVVHPQFWPQDLDYTGKRVVVIGSGATAVTIVPTMTDKAAHVTMLQRTPTWMAAGPRQDRIGKVLRRWLPESWAYWLTRQKNIRLRDYFFKLSRRDPEKLAKKLREMLRHDLGPAYSAEHFEPPYDPWKQRLCLVPDGDLFKALRSGKADVVTDHVAGFDAGGVKLASGKYLPADIVVTATGLRLVLAGKVAVSIDGKKVEWPEHYYYRGTMFSNVPNLAVTFGYLNASWTLRADNNSEFVARVLNEMEAENATVVIPLLAPEDEPEVVEPFDYTSGYLHRAKPLMPKSAAELPWRLNHDYLADVKDFRQRPVADGVLRFTNPGDPALSAALPQSPVARTEEPA